MTDVAILGAGEIGGAIAHLLARRDIVGRIRVIDDSGQVASGKALDIMHAAPIESFATRVSGATDLTAAAGATLFVIADRMGGDEWQGDEGLTLVRRLIRLVDRPVVLCAGACQRELVERAVRELGMSRLSIFGSAPEALAGAIRALVALEVDGSPRDVALTVLGVPPAQWVVPWDDATVGGLSVLGVLDGPTRGRLAARASLLWPLGPYALAAAAVCAIAGVVGASHRRVATFVAPDDRQGRRHRTVSLPARLGPRGVAEVLLPTLSVHDRVALDNAMLL